MDDEQNMVSVQETLQDTSQENKQSAVDQQGGHVPPVFVVGVWRSGTTLLYSLLNQHPDLRLFYESDLPVLWPMFHFSGGRHAWREKWEYWNAGLSRHDLDPERLQGRVDSLAREFPDARFVIIWREPEEVCLSVIKARATAMWFTRPGMTHKALLASRILKKQVEKIISMGALVHQLHFRDLIEKTDPTMRGICQFLQLPFDPAMTVLSKADRTAVFEGGHHKLAMGDKIVAKKEKKESVPPELGAKISRYKTLWKSQFGDSWMLSARFAQIDVAKPTLSERFKDQLLMLALRTWDIAPRICFSVLPLSAWQTYRKLKYKDPEWIQRHITTKESKFPIKSHAKGAQFGEPCAVRFGKILLQSMDTEDLLSSDNDRLKQVVTVHAEIFSYAHENPAFESILKHTVNTIDGRVIHHMCSMLYPGRGLRKLSGSDFIYNLADHASKRGERIFLLGADPEANKGALDVLKIRYPELTVEGFSPSFSADIADQKWNEDILSRISESRP